MKKPVLLMLFAAALAAALIYVLQFQGAGETQDTGVRRGVEQAESADQSPGAALKEVASKVEGPGRSAATVDPESAPNGPSGAKGSGESLDSDDELTRLIGTVTDVNGAPLEGASVMVRRGGFEGFLRGGDGPKEFTETSGADGAFSLRSFGGSVEVAVGADGFAPFDRALDATSGEVTDMGELRLTMGVSLAGRVVDSTGAGVPGAFLIRKAETRGGITFVRGAPEPDAITGPGGEFEILRQAAGPYEFEVTHKLHPPARLDGTIERPGDKVSDLVVLLERGASLSGMVTGMPASESNLKVRAYSLYGSGVLTMDSSVGPMVRRVDVQNDGSFELTGMRPGEMMKLRLFQGMNSYDDRSRRSESVEFKVPAAGLGEPVMVPYSLGTSLRFAVVDSEGAVLKPDRIQAGFGYAPIVEEFDQDPATGEIILSGYWPDEEGSDLEMTITHPGFEVWSSEKVTVVPGGVHDLGRIVLKSRPTVEFTVLDDRTGDPVSGARVAMTAVNEETSGPKRVAVRFDSTESEDEDELELPDIFDSAEVMKGKTDDDGVCRLDATAGALVSLRVTEGEHAPWTQEDVRLPESMTNHPITARLEAGGALLVTVTEPSGQPAKGFEVEFDQSQDGAPLNERRSEKSDASGQLTLQGLPIGAHQVRLRKKQSGGMMVFPGEMIGAVAAPDEPETWTTVTIVAGQVTEVNLVAPATGSLVGRVREKQIKLSGATLKLKDPKDDPMAGLGLFGSGSKMTAKTDAGGQYRIEGIEVGEYKLSLDHPTRAMPFTMTVTIEPGENDLDLDLHVTEVTGRVLDGAGEPVAGARVSAELFTKDEDSPTRMMSITFVGDGDGEGATIGFGGAVAEAVLTGEDGGYRLRGVVPDVEILVNANAEGFDEAKSEPFSVTKGSTRDGLDVAFKASGSLKIEVEDANGRMFAIVQKKGRGAPKVEPLKDGKADLPALAPGTYTVSIQSTSGATFEPASLEVEVVVGEEVTAAFAPASR